MNVRKENAKLQARRTKRGSQRDAAPKNYWTKHAPALKIGREEWRLEVLRGDRSDLLNLGSEFLSADWTDDESRATATVTLSRPFLTAHGVIEQGHLFILSFRANSETSGWHEVWRMRVDAPTVTVKAKEVSFALVEDSVYLARSKDKWHFGKTKAQPHGVRLRSIIQKVCKQYGIPVGALPRSLNHRVKSFSVDGSVEDVFVKVLLLERNEGEGRRLTWTFRRGKFYVQELKRPTYMLALADAIIEATYTESFKAKVFTAATVRGTLKAKDGKKKKKLKLVVRSEPLIRRYGYIHKVLDAPKGVDSVREARKYALNEIIDSMTLKKEVTFSHVGIPQVRRWDALKLRMPQIDMDQVVFVNSVAHSLTAADYSMEVTVRLTDPFIDERGEKLKLKRCKARKKRGEKLGPECQRLIREDRKKDKKSKQRS